MGSKGRKNVKKPKQDKGKKEEAKKKQNSGEILNTILPEGRTNLQTNSNNQNPNDPNGFEFKNQILFRNQYVDIRIWSEATK